MKILTLCLLAALSCVPNNSRPQAGAAQTGISPEALRIYQDFLVSYQKQEKASGKLNLVQTTTAIFQAGDRDECLKRFTAQELHPAHQQGHQFDADSTKDWPVVLIDAKKAKLQDPEDLIRKGVPVEEAVKAGFASGHFTLSEIVFNQDHTLAVFSYGFHCGSLCGNGGTVLYEKKDDTWSRSSARCTAYIN